jgi:FkbH-like protein
LFEFEQYDRHLHEQHPGEKKVQFTPEAVSPIRSFALLNWGEHCVECAFPACYRTCELYRPRADGRCRRFKFGIGRSKDVRTSLRYSAYVRFKDSSHLWSQGNATQLPHRLTRALLLIHDLFLQMLAAVDRRLHALVGRTYLLLAFQAVRRRTLVVLGRLYRLFPRPDAFRIDLFNPSDETYDLLFFVRGLKTHFEAGAKVRPGFNVLEYPVRDIEQRVDLARSFRLSFYLTEAENKELYICFASFVRYHLPIGASSATEDVPKARKVKCLVWDLDGTLWDGILLESESGKMQLKDGVRTILSELDKRGILLSVASKNTADDAIAALEALQVKDYFLIPQINWLPKSQSIHHIADELNIGIDTLAFIDDSPFELDEVRAQCPEVLCLCADEYMTLLGRPEFTGDSSSDSAQRRRFYQTEMIRKSDRAQHGSDIDEFLAMCDIRVRLSTPAEDEVQRVHELVQRTNQLNFSGVRYTRDDIVEMVHDPRLRCHVVHCADRYGDYGIVGFCVVDEGATEPLIRDMMLSCRIQGKKVEHSIICHIAGGYFAKGHEAVYARYHRTSRNQQAGQVFEDLGFARRNGNADADLLMLERDACPDVAYPVHILEDSATQAHGI